MTWWRRDSTFSPVQRYAQRLLRSHESALRTRGFSRTPPQNAPHGDDKGSDRPAGMSNLEWMQLQHYQRWRKKLMEDPYQTLFGASNDMLNGKGLKDWEWISNSFPKWMLREIGGHEDANPPSKRDKDTNSSKRYSKKTEMENDLSSSPRERESYFLQPTPRTTRIGGDDSRGIISPSDLRRPREHPEVTVIGKSVETSTEPSSDTHGSTVSASAPQTSQHTPPTPPKTTQSFSDYIVKTKSNAASKVEHLDKTQNESGASFMDGFLSENPQQEERTVSSSSDVSTWKETTLQRRLSQSDVMKHKASEETSASTPVVKEGENASSISVASEHPRMPPVAETIPTAATHESQKLPKSEDKNTLGDSAVPTRSTSETLSQLPEDDIDFLSAADIRASMGMKRSKIVSDEQKKAERENLEKSFTDAHVESEGVDPMIESKVINDQLVRRIERKMQMPDEPEANESQPTTKPEQSSDLASETQIESSIERMRSWLEQGGAIFSNYFWQDPTEEADAKKTRLFFDKVLARIRKGRSTMKQVIEDLETDIPSSKPLLKRMKADEDLLDSAIHALRQRSGSGKMQPLTPKKVRAIQSLRLKYQDTDSDLNKAYVALQEIDKSDSAKNMPLAFKQRLGLAAKIIQKNAHLTRYLIWSLQARLEDPDIDPTMLPNYKAVANSLLTLRDTQMALSRLVDRAMLVYGVMPQTVENVDSMGQTSVNTSTQHGEMLPSEASASMTEVDKAQLRAKIAAEERLANEVDAQKSAMRGLSDDGYVGESNEIGKKPFEERSPLDHSLYRPFGQVLQSLGSELPLGMEATKPQEKAAQKYNDAELVVELQKAYEDTYGPITAGHMQVAEAAEEMKQEQENDVKKFDMLKDDPTTCDEAPQQASVTQMPETQVTEETTEAVATPQAVQEDDAVTAQPECSVEDTASSPQPTEVPPESAVETSSTASTSPVPIADLPTHYTILIHDAETNTISLTTSTSPPPRDTAPPIPLHTALSTLSSPSKFIPHITPNLEIVTAKPDMLILRDVPNPATPPSSSPNVISKPLQPTEHNDATEGTATSDLGTQRIGTVNPIDGTTRLSPTGYVGPAENREQLEKEFEERRRAAEQIAALGAAAENEHVGQAGFAGEKKRRVGGRGAGVVKTAIWAAATCYVVGVLGELVG